MKQGNIYYTDKDFTDLEVSTTFKYPCMLILKNAVNEIEKITTYNENGIKSIYDFSLSASKQFVTDSISPIQASIISLQNDKLEKSTYIGTAQDLKNDIDNIQIGGRNLLLNSKGEFKPQDEIIDNNQLYLNSTIFLENGKKYIISAKTNGFFSNQHNNTVESDACTLWFLKPDYSIGQIVSDTNTSTGTIFTCTMPTGTYVLRVNVYHPNSTNTIKCWEVKVEKGNIATDWTPNPEDKQDRLQDVTGNIGLGKTDASATEKLDIAGRTKSDGIVINETTSAILPKEMKFKDGKFKAALADGVEKAVLLEGDAGGVDFKSFTKLLLNENFGWQKPNWGDTTYQTFSMPQGAIMQQGHTNEGSGLGSYAGYGISYISSSSTIAYLHGGSHLFAINDNSISTRRFKIATNLSTQRIYIGFSDNYRFYLNHPVSVQLDSLTNFIGICMESGNTNLLLMFNDGGGTASIIDTGFINAINYVYELTLSSVYGLNIVNVKLDRINETTGSISTFTYLINTNIQTFAGKMSFALWCIDTLEASPVKVIDYGGTCTWRYKTF